MTASGDEGPDERGGRARPGYHDPTYRLAGAAPARSALTLRLVLAGFGLLVCAGGAVLFAALGASWTVVLALTVLALVAIDLVVIVRRKRRGEPGQLALLSDLCHDVRGEGDLHTGAEHVSGDPAELASTLQQH